MLVCYFIQNISKANVTVCALGLFNSRDLRQNKEIQSLNLNLRKLDVFERTKVIPGSYGSTLMTMLLNSSRSFVKGKEIFQQNCPSSLCRVSFKVKDIT